MAKDAELERLARAQEQAFRSRQDAYEAMQRAWERRSTARDAASRAYEANQSAYEAMQEAWQRYQSVRQANGPRIDALNAQQETAFQNMKRSFEAASSAHERRDGAAAKSHATDGHRYKAESQGYVAERRRLVDEIKAARAPHDATTPTFEQTKQAFRAAKEAHNRAKAEHERVQAEFNQRRAEAERAKEAFHNRLEQLKKQGKQRQDDKRVIAEKAGVPYQYRDNVWISRDSDGNTNVYFGGAGEPNGPGHGHYVMNRNGEVTYRRDPFDPHGAQNFEENRREDPTRQMAQMAMNQWAKTQTTPWMVQHEDVEFKVLVKAGYDRRHDAIVTDVLIHDRQNRREHYHLVIDEHGNELFSEWRPNRRRI